MNPDRATPSVSRTRALFVPSRLWLVCAGMVLCASRLGLIAHELFGHGGAAWSIGAEVTALRLFWFQGGWIRYERAEAFSVGEALWVSLAGIAVELILSIALFALARRTRRPRLRAGAAALATLWGCHALFYLAAGTFHGFGDGRGLHLLLGDQRLWIALGGGAALVAAAYFGTREAVRSLVPWMRAAPGRRAVAELSIALAVAGVCNLGLALGEREIRRRDTVYAATMRSQVQYEIDREAVRLEREMADRGQRVGSEQRAALRRKLEREHREFPFKFVLIVLMALSALLAAVRVSLRRELAASTADPAAWPVAAAAAALVAAVVILDRLI